MPLYSSALFLVFFCVTSAAFAAQTPASPPPVAAPISSPPSAALQPALDTLQQTLGTLRPDKWKAPGAVREEAGANISSIRRDLESTLPQLLAGADKAPGSVAQMLPAFRNIEALYDVLLRVAEAGNLSAPSEQNAAMEEARSKLEDGRRALGDRLLAAALAQERQVHDLQAAVRTVPPAPAPVACPPPPPVKKHRTPKKTVTKPAPAPINTQASH